MIERGPQNPRMTQDEYDIKCLNAMVACNWSFAQFSIGAFRELLDTGHGFEVPTPKIMKARLKKYTKLAQNEIKERLANNDSRISLALDCWSSSNRLEFMGICPASLPAIFMRSLIVAITSHYIDENFVLQEDLLDFTEVDWSHSGINLSEHIHEVLFKYDICEKLFCITTDNASNNDTTCEELSDRLYESHSINWNWEENHIGCLAHVLNLSVQAFLKNIKVTEMSEAERFALPSAAPAQSSRAPPPPAKKYSKHSRKTQPKDTNPPTTINTNDLDFASTIKKLRKISAAINWPRSRTRDFWLFADAKRLKRMKAIQDNDTRWSATCNMIKRAVYLRPAIDPWIKTREELQEFALSDREWELAEFLLRFLEPFRRATTTIQTAERPTLHKTFLMYEKLFNNLENVKAIFEKMEVVPEWFDEVRTAINTMWVKVKEHYSKTKNPSAYVDANILHPGRKLHLFKKKDSSFAEVPDQAKIYENEARARFDKLYNNSISGKSTPEHSNALKRKREMDSDGDSSDSSDNDELLKYNEFDHYLRIKRDKSVKHPLAWWGQNYGMFPKMGKWYRDVGPVPASSAGVEREFSMAGDIITKKRNRLSGKTISDIMQYKRWRARRGEHIVEEPREIPEEYNESDSDAESEFDERNIELEEWLGKWMENKDLGEVARGLFSDDA